MIKKLDLIDILPLSFAVISVPLGFTIGEYWPLRFIYVGLLIGAIAIGIVSIIRASLKRSFTVLPLLNVLLAFWLVLYLRGFLSVGFN
jgi:hypothetical protein